MLEIIKAIVLGFVQGATEFIPVSSSGHLVIVPWLLGWEPFGLVFDTMLHWGTLLAIFAVFWRDFWAMIKAVMTSLTHHAPTDLRVTVALQPYLGKTLANIISRSLADPNARMAWFIIFASIPAAIAGLSFKDQIEALFSSPRTAAVFLLFTAALLAGSEQMIKRLKNLHTLEKQTLADSLIIGLAQAVALAPGISRSGSTMAAGLARGLRRDEAARFSFLLGTPAFFGAGLLALKDALSVDASQVQDQMSILVVGFIVSALTGFMAIRFLLNYLRTRSLYLFAGYCAVVGLIVVGLTFVW